MKGAEKGLVANITETFRGGPGQHFCSKINNYFWENEELEKDIEAEFFLKNSFTSLLSKVPNLKRNFYAHFSAVKKKEVKKRLFYNFESIIDKLSDEDIIRIHKRLKIENGKRETEEDDDEEEEEDEEEDDEEEEEEEEVEVEEVENGYETDEENERKVEVENGYETDEKNERNERKVELENGYETDENNKRKVEEIKEEYKEDPYEKQENETNEEENLLGYLHEWRNGTKERVRNTNYRENTFSLVSTIPENINLEKLLWLHINTNNYSEEGFVNFNKRINDIWDFYIDRSSIMDRFGRFSKWNNFIFKKMLKTSAVFAEYGNKRSHSKYKFQRHKHVYCSDMGSDMLSLLRKCHFKWNMLTKRSRYRICRDYIKESLNFEIKINAQNFIKINQVGQGAYGDVWLAEDISNAKRMALKKLKLRDIRQGFAKTYIREISLLNTLKHPNIVELLGVICALAPDLHMKISMQRLNMQMRKRKGIYGNSLLGGSRMIELEKGDSLNNMHTSEEGSKEEEIEVREMESNTFDTSTAPDSSKTPVSSKDVSSFSSGKTYMPFVELNKQNQIGYTLWMVFEYIPFDMSGYLEALRQERNNTEKLKYTSLFTISEIKDIMLQLLTAVSYCHEQNIMHRDIKTSNLLIDAEGTLKLADFGLARFYSASEESKLVNRVITLWYRPPELLLGETKYDDSVDIWSCGCVFGELLTNAPLFSGEDEVEVLKMIANKTRMPPRKHMLVLEKWNLWNDIRKNPLHPANYTVLNEEKKNDFENKLLKIPGVTSLGLDLLRQMLRWNPISRISAKKALQHPWFYTEPLPHAITKKENIKAAHSFMTKYYKKIDMIQSSSNLRRQEENFRCMNVGKFRKMKLRNSFDFNKIILRQKLNGVQ